VILGILVAAGFVATDTIRLPSSEAKPALADTPKPGNSSSPIPTNGGASPVEKTPARPLSVNAPLRLWIGGDSLSWAPGISLGRLVENTGVVQSYLDSHTSTGLNAQENLNWNRRAADTMAHVNPDQVIFTIGANDWTIVASNPKGADGQPAWTTKWRNEVGEMMDVLVGSNHTRSVYWIGTPPMQSSAMNQAVVQLNAIAADEASKRGTVTFIDSYKLFADANGRYADRLPDPETGRRLLLRAGDGIHFSGDGGDWMAAELMRHLESDWQIMRQSVPGHQHPIIESKDATAQPGHFIQSTKSTTTTGAGTLSTAGSRGAGSTTTGPSNTTGTPPTTGAATTDPPSTTVITAAPVTTGATTAPPTTAPPTTAGQ